MISTFVFFGGIVGATLWDWLFGTCENPALFESTCGFDAEKEERQLNMPVYRDVHRER